MSVHPASQPLTAVAYTLTPGPHAGTWEFSGPWTPSNSIHAAFVGPCVLMERRGDHPLPDPPKGEVTAAEVRAWADQLEDLGWRVDVRVPGA